jgi:hypothetical protein
MATIEDIQVTHGVVNSGTIVISCDGSCDNPRLEHRYMFYTPEEALEAYNYDHNE